MQMNSNEKNEKHRKRIFNEETFFLMQNFVEYRKILKREQINLLRD